MARPAPVQPLRVPPAFVAAAFPFDPGDRKAVKAALGKRQEWQEDGWDYFDEFGFIKYGLSRLATDASAARLFATFDAGEGPQPAGDSDLADQWATAAQQLVDGFADRDGGQSELIRVGVLNVSVAGELFLIPTVDDRGMFAGYQLRSTSEIVVASDGRLGDRDDNGQARPVVTPEGMQAIRVFRRHGRRWDRADSSMLGVLADCETALIARSAIRAALKSRAGAGLVTLPKGLVGPSGAPVTDLYEAAGEGAEDGPESPFVAEWRDAFTAAVATDGSPSAVMPLALIGESDDLTGVRWIEIGRKVDPDTVRVYEQARVAIMQGLDFPIEVVAGVGGMNHWGAWAVTEAMWVAHGRPALGVIAHAGVYAHLRPRLAAQGCPPEIVAQMGIGIDDSAVLSAPPSREDAIAAANMGAIGQRSLRATLRFDDSDAVNDTDNLPTLRPTAPGAPLPAGSDVTGPPALTAAGTRSPAGLGAELAAADRVALQRCALQLDQAASRALDRAGARIRSHAKGALKASLDGIPNWRVPRQTAGQLATFGVDEDELVADAADGVDEQFALLAAAAQRKTRRALGRHTSITQDDLALLNARQDTDRAGAARWLSAAFLTLLRVELYAPGPATTGEWTGRLAGAPGLARNALARAGGAVALDDRPGMVSNGQPVLGVASGPSTLDAAAAQGVRPAGFVWEWGQAERPFPPHEALDTITFTGWDDDVVAVPDDYAWMDIPFLHPGDHGGCTCNAPLVFTEGTES